MGLTGLQYEEGQTPLDADETDAILIRNVTTRSELDEVEQRNIEDAIRWTMERRKRFTADEILSEEFVMGLHKRMYGAVWSWAGSFRKTNKNIGVDKYEIGFGLRTLLDDCRYWINNKTFSDDEIAIRFKHRIVSVHCFPNGNGRHSRLMADLIIEKIFNNDVFSWGGRHLIKRSNFRSIYLKALREADWGNIDPLVAFARDE